MNLRDSQKTLTQAIEFNADLDALQRASNIIDCQHANASDRIMIYRHSITGMQQHVLAIIYPVCKEVLGEACFDTLARDYAWDNLSNCSDLNHYGSCFPQFLQRSMSRHKVLAEIIYLNDLAMLEWAWHQAHYTQDDPQYDSKQLSDILQTEESPVPAVSYSLSVIHSRWPVLDIWIQHQKNTEKTKVDLHSKDRYMLVYRSDEVRTVPIDRDIYRFFLLSQTNHTLSEIAETMDDQAVSVFKQLGGFIQEGWISGFKNQKKDIHTRVHD